MSPCSSQMKNCCNLKQVSQTNIGLRKKKTEKIAQEFICSGFVTWETSKNFISKFEDKLGDINRVKEKCVSGHARNLSIRFTTASHIKFQVQVVLVIRNPNDWYTSIFLKLLNRLV